MNCSGLVVACSFDHRVADAYSANMFLVSWSEIARSKPSSPPPSLFSRSLLNPRHPARPIHPSIPQMYVPISSLPPPKETLLPVPDDDHYISRIYYIASNNINELQSLANGGAARRTKLESFSAFLWKMVAISEANGNGKTTDLGIIVDGRRRISSRNEMSTYFGNVISLPFAGEEVKRLTEKPLSWVAEQVHEKILQNALSKDHFLDLIDWVETNRPEKVLNKMYYVRGDEGSAVIVSSGQHFPIYEVDFGWGRPVFGSYYFPVWGAVAGYVMPMPSPVKDGDWVVYMNLMKRHLEVIECEAANVFRPLTSDYLLSQ